MKSYRSYGGGSFLKKEDFPSPQVYTVCDVKEQTITAPGKKPEDRLVLFFNETTKGLVLNMVNGDTLFDITKRDDPEEWVGLQVELFNDPTVTYAGKRIGGVRLRKPQMEQPY